MDDEIKKDGPISQLIVLNDNMGVTSLFLPFISISTLFILCWSYIFFVNENKLRICYNIKK